MSQPQKRAAYWLAYPWTWKTGPGHKVHLTRDTKKTRCKKALCQVERNALRMEGVHWQKEPWTLQQVQSQVDLRRDNRRLCKNCTTIAKRRERNG